MIWIYAMDTINLSRDLNEYRRIIPDERLYQLSVRPEQELLLGLAAELLFQRAVRRHCPGMPCPVSRDRQENGKPYLLGRPDFHFNLSHSGNWAVCAVADAPVGVDIQQERPVNLRLSRRFSLAEQQSLVHLMGYDYTKRLFDLWALKESYVKCTGAGLTCPMKSFDGEAPGPGYSTQLVDFVSDGYHLGVCTQQEEPDEVQLLIIPF